VSARFRHEAVLYDGTDGFMDAIVPFLREGAVSDEPMLVAVDAPKIARLKEALGVDAGGVRFAEMRALGRNPACIIPAWREFVLEHASAGRPMRGVGEPIWAGREGAELDECHRHESLLNTAFDGGPTWTLLCPYDTSALPEHVIDDARCTHPVVSTGETHTASDTYRARYAETLLGELPEPDGYVEELAYGLDDLGTVRGLVMAWGVAAGLSAQRAADMVLAVNELASNSVRYGGGTGVLRSWREGGRFVCEVRDGGRIEDPLIGRALPVDEAPTGRGLWLVNQVCDLVQVRSLEPGAVARLHMAI
jgi:anti-sigma regulatory factor (Ser/Thr protein kinase)